MTDGGIGTGVASVPRTDIPRRPRARPISERTFRVLLVLVLVLLAVSVASQLALPGHARLVAQAATWFVAAAASTAFALVGIVRTTGVDRRWRLLVSAGPLSALPGAIQWTYQYSSGDPAILRLTPDESLFLLAPILTIIGLISMPAGANHQLTRAPPSHGAWLPRYSHTVIALDSLMIIISMLLIAWFALLRDVVESGISGTSFAIAIGFSVTSVLLIVVLVLVVTFRQPRNIRALGLLGAGLLAVAASETVLVRLSLPDPADLEATVPLWLGASVGPLLVALAMITPEREAQQQPAAAGAVTGRATLRAGELRRWLHAYLPYLPLGVAAVLVVSTALRTNELSGLPLYLSLCLASLVSLRQIIAIAENRRLVDNVWMAQRRLQHQADHDGLTGLANRALFNRTLERAVAAHSEYGQPVVVLFCDIDHFKSVNDTYGHHAGDRLLRTVATRLRAALRHGDLAARLGGDEFAVLLADADGDPRSAGSQCARRITVAMARPVLLGDEQQPIMISIGIAHTNGYQPATSAEQILHQADTAMYHAKHERRQITSSSPW